MMPAFSGARFQCLPSHRVATVFHAYRTALGLGPRRYFELKRLNALRARLRTADPAIASVTALANELGFGDVGRMAGRYRALFGEAPSHTLLGA